MCGLRFLLVLLVSLNSHGLALIDCDAAPTRILYPGHFAKPDSSVVSASGDSRAVWLDADEIFWPQSDVASGRFKLYFSSNAGLAIDAKGRLVSSEKVVTLAANGSTLRAELLPRFGYLGTLGALLKVQAADRAALADMQRGQLLLVRQDLRGRVLDSTHVQLAAYLDQTYAPAADVADLGVTLGASDTRFKLWAPTARAVALCVYPGADQAAATFTPMQFDAGTGIWAGAENSRLNGQFYRYLVDVYAPGTGIVRNLVTDPYSISLNTDSARSFITDLTDPALAPKGWADNVRAPTLIHAVDMSIYELHVRDFSANDASISTKNRGKYLAFTETKSNGMRHLNALAQAGMTDVHLLPVFDFATVPEAACATPKIPRAGGESETQQAITAKNQQRDCFNWGYDPWHFGAPEGSYASDANDGARRIIEFRAMVDALHRTGLRVGMDVVYNHTAASGQNLHSVLDRIVPGYYQRLDGNGKVERSTCCDNTATENRMMEKLMIDTAVRWVRDYRVDSFRFDLMGHQPKAAMQALQIAANAAAREPVFLLGEGWNFGEVSNNKRFVQAAQLSLAGSGIASFSDRARDAIRGGGCCDSGADLLRNQGYINGLSYAPNALALEKNPVASLASLRDSSDLIRVGLAGTLKDFELETADGTKRKLADINYAGQTAGYAAEPGEVVNYVENHDNPTLFDINVLKLPTDTTAAERARVQMLAAATVAFSQGISYYHAGMEGLRSKSLDRNSFDSGDWFNRLDWTFSDNYFASGLPPRADNGGIYALYRPLLSNAALKPTAADIRWTRDVFFDLLRIRKSSRLFRLTRTIDVQRRLSFVNTGPGQVPTVLAAVLDGTDLADANFARVAYFINVDVKAHNLVLPAQANQAYVLHPVQRAKTAADRRVRQARFDAKSGAFTVPARSAVVYVVETQDKEAN